jgi:NRPS condensation-like uncharacterized protein
MTFNTSVAQKDMSITEAHSWLLSQASPHTTAFKIGLTEKLDIAKLQQAIIATVSQQPSLQLTVNGSTPTFGYHSKADCNIQCIVDVEWQTFLEAQLAEFFNNDDVLFRFYIIDNSTTEIVVFIHHIV